MARSRAPTVRGSSSRTCARRSTASRTLRFPRSATRTRSTTRSRTSSARGAERHVNENKTTALPPHLLDLRREVEGYAKGFGLDFYETIFEVLGYDEINMVAAYGGFSHRYPHWGVWLGHRQPFQRDQVGPSQNLRR